MLPLDDRVAERINPDLADRPVLIATLSDDLAARGIRLAIAGVLPQVRRMLERSGALDRLAPDSLFRTLLAAVDAHERSRTSGGTLAASIL